VGTSRRAAARGWLMASLDRIMCMVCCLTGTFLLHALVS
jgi:hypothetical protein